MKYTIVSAHTPEELAKSINSYLSDGWELAGGPFTVDHGDLARKGVRVWYQAVHK